VSFTCPLWETSRVALSGHRNRGGGSNRTAGRTIAVEQAGIDRDRTAEAIARSERQRPVAGLLHKSRPRDHRAVGQVPARVKPHRRSVAHADGRKIVTVLSSPSAITPPVQLALLVHRPSALVDNEPLWATDEASAAIERAEKSAIAFNWIFMTDQYTRRFYKIFNDTANQLDVLAIFCSDQARPIRRSWSFRRFQSPASTRTGRCFGADGGCGSVLCAAGALGLTGECERSASGADLDGRPTR
jgi:hypothetical protein